MHGTHDTGRPGGSPLPTPVPAHGPSSSIPGRAVVLALLLVAALAIAPSSASAQDGGGEPDPMAVELWQRLEILVVSVIDGDNATLDQATCLGDLVHAQLEREQALGLVPDALDPTLVAERQSRARARARAYVLELIETGDQVEAIEISRIREFDGSETGETLVAEGPRALPITAAGILGVDLLDLPRRIDLSVYRLGTDRWCFDPLSMPGE